MDGIRRDSYGIYGNGKTDAVPDRVLFVSLSEPKSLPI